jgi:hypothetical protein
MIDQVGGIGSCPVYINDEATHNGQAMVLFFFSKPS